MPPMWMQRFENGPPLDRIHLKYPAERGHTAVRVFSGCKQRLLASADLDALPYHYHSHALESILGSFQSILSGVPISTLTVHIYGALGEDEWMRILARQFPHIRRLELLPRTIADVKSDFAKDFLQTYSDQDPESGLSSDLTLAWVFHLRSRRRKDEEAAREVESLVSVLKQSRRCARLELYSMLSCEYRSWHRSLADIPSNAARTRRLVAPVLTELSELVDELVIW